MPRDIDSDDVRPVCPPRPARRHPRHRPQPRRVRTVLHPEPRRHGRRRHQDRGARPGRRVARVRPAVSRRRGAVLPVGQPRQAQLHPQPEERQGQSRAVAAARRRRCAGRELPAGRHGAARARLRDGGGAVSASRLLLDLGFRGQRPRCRTTGLRPHRAGRVRADGPDRRRRRSAHAHRHRDHRSHRRDDGGAGDHPGALRAAQDRPRAAGQDRVARHRGVAAHLQCRQLLRLGREPLAGAATTIPRSRRIRPCGRRTAG